MKINKHNKQYISTTNTNYCIEFEPLEKFVDTKNFPKDLFVVKVSSEDANEYVHNKNSFRVVNGVIESTKLDTLLENPSQANMLLIFQNPVWAVKKGFLKDFTESGNDHRLAELLPQNERDFEVKDILSKKEPMEFVQSVITKGFIKIWKDEKNNNYTEPMVLDYSFTEFNDKKYNLEKLVTKLMQRDDIAFISDSETRDSKNKKLLKYPLTGNESGFQDVISNIPDYDAEDGKSKIITIVYYPKSEDLNKILSYEAKDYKVDTVKYIVDEILDANTCLNQTSEVNNKVKMKM